MRPRFTSWVPARRVDPRATRWLEAELECLHELLYGHTAPQNGVAARNELYEEPDVATPQLELNASTDGLFGGNAIVPPSSLSDSLVHSTTESNDVPSQTSLPTPSDLEESIAEEMKIAILRILRNLRLPVPPGFGAGRLKIVLLYGHPECIKMLVARNQGSRVELVTNGSSFTAFMETAAQDRGSDNISIVLDLDAISANSLVSSNESRTNRDAIGQFVQTAKIVIWRRNLMLFLVSQSRATLSNVFSIFSRRHTCTPSGV